MIKNAMAYRLPEGFTLPDNLNEQLSNGVLGDIDPQAAELEGWVSPFEDDQFTIKQECFVMLKFGLKEKYIPPAILNRMVTNQVKIVEKRSGNKVHNEERTNIKNDLHASLLPSALVKETYIELYFDTSNHLLIIDTAIDSVADRIITYMREMLKTFAVKPLAPVGVGSVATVLSQWLADENEMPDDFEMGNEVMLKSNNDDNSTITANKFPGFGEQMSMHLEHGFTVSKIGLDFAHRISFTLTDDMCLKKIRLDEDALDSHEVDDVTSNDRVIPDFYIMAAELKGVFAALLKHFSPE